MRNKILIFFVILLAVSCINSRQLEFEYNDFIFGSYLRIIISAQDSVQANQVIKNAMQILHHIDTVASSFNPQSEVSQLNRQLSLIMSSDLKGLVLKAQEISQKSGGAFDITIGPAMKKYGFYQSGQNEHTDNILLESLISYEKIKVIGDSIYLKPGMTIDLGGLAVGYALDKVVELLKSAGIITGLIDAGGDIVCFGKKTYSIGVKNPQGKGLLRVIKIKNRAISTSGSYEKYLVQGNQKYTHIINPKTTEAIAETEQGLVSVTVIADKCVDADAYATAIFVLGVSDGQKLICKLQLQGIMMTKEGKIIEVR